MWARGSQPPVGKVMLAFAARIRVGGTAQSERVRFCGRPAELLWFQRTSVTSGFGRCVVWGRTGWPAAHFFLVFRALQTHSAWF